MIDVPTSSQTYGRPYGVRLVVMHMVQCPPEEGRAESTAWYLAGLTGVDRASAHYVVDPCAVVRQVDENNQAWAAPGANTDGIQIEQAGYSETIAANWQVDPYEQMIHTQVVPLVAGICQRWGIPPVWLEAADILAGKYGVTGHVQVNEAYGRSDHWDPGPGYPGEEVVELVAKRLGLPTEPDFDEDDEELMHVLRAEDNTLYLVRSDHKLLLGDALRQIGVDPTDESIIQAANELFAAHLTPEPWSNTGWYALGLVPWETAPEPPSSVPVAELATAVVRQIGVALTR